MGTTSPFNPGQLAQLGTNLNIAVATALPGIAAKYDPKSLLKAMEGRGQWLADKLGPALEQILNRLFVLSNLGATIVGIDGSDPDAFFQTREGLWISDDFRRLVVANAKPTGLSTFRLGHGLLVEDMADEKIEGALLNGYIFDDSTACAVIEAMIKDQWGGKEGKLLNSGYANLFYLSSCVVYVRWRAGRREWSVDTWERDDRKWYAGYQVFSPATAT